MPIVGEAFRRRSTLLVSVTSAEALTRTASARGGKMDAQQRASGKQVSVRMSQREGPSRRRVLSAAKESRPRTRSGGPSCKAWNAMQTPWRAPQTRGTATALAVARSGKHNASHANAAHSPAARTERPGG